MFVAGHRLFLRSLSPSQWRRVVFVVFVLAVALRVGHLALSSDNPLLYLPVLDERFYVESGKAIAEGDWLGEGAGFFMDPAYSYFLGIIFFLAGDNFTTVRLVQILLDSFSILLICAVGSKIWNRFAGITGALCYAVYPVAFYYSLLLLKTTLTSTSLLLFVFLFINALKTGNSIRWFILGIFSGLMMYLRANLILIIPLTILCIFLSYKSLNTPMWITVLIFLTGASSLVALNGLRSYSAGNGVTLFNTQGGRLLYSCNNPDNLTGRYNVPSFARPDPELSEKDFRREAERRLGKTLSPKEVSRYWRQEAVKFLFENPGKAILILYNKITSMITNCEIPNNHSYYVASRFSPLIGWSFPCFAFIFAFGVCGLAAGAWRAPEAAVLIMPLATILITTVLFYSCSRFRMPVVPFLCIGTGICASILINWLKERKWVRLCSIASLMTVLATVSLLIPCPAQSGNESYFLARAYWKVGDIDRAFDAAMHGKKVYPDQARFYNLIGMILLSMDMPHKAIMSYKRGLKLQPDNADILHNMGLLYLSMGRPQEAIAFFKKTLSVEPRSSSLFYMGMAYENMNEKALAFESYSRYLDISKKDDPLRLKAKQFLAPRKDKYGN